MSRLQDLEHVVERAAAVGIKAERLRGRMPTVLLRPCPGCGGGCAVAEWDGFGVLLWCRSCDGSGIADVLLHGWWPTWHLSRLIPTPEELELWLAVVAVRLAEVAS
jgi:hypothetical protein